jgi:DNA-binding NarL/FixJ family response regulator
MAVEGYGARNIGAIRILLVDDHPIVRPGLRQMIASEPPLRAVFTTM